MTGALCCSKYSVNVSSKPFTIIDGNLSGPSLASLASLASLVPGVDDLGRQVERVVVAGGPVLQQAQDELLQGEFLLLVFLVRPELPERPRSQGPEEAGGGWR